MGFSKKDYEQKPVASTEYLEGSMSKQLSSSDKYLHQTVESDGSAEDMSLAADVGGEHLVAIDSGSSDAASAADV